MTTAKITSGPSLIEARGDLDNTASDIAQLTAITHHLECFLTESGGENRSAFRTDLLKYRALLAEATALWAKIKARIEELEGAK